MNRFSVRCTVKLASQKKLAPPLEWSPGQDWIASSIVKTGFPSVLQAASVALIALAAALVAQRAAPTPVLANCFGYGGEQASFLLEAV